MRNVRRVHLTDIWSWYRVELRVGDHLGRSEELVSRCAECDLAEPESLASLGGSAPGVVDGILSACLMGSTIDSQQPYRLSNLLLVTELLTLIAGTFIILVGAHGPGPPSSPGPDAGLPCTDVMDPAIPPSACGGEAYPNVDKATAICRSAAHGGEAYPNAYKAAAIPRSTESSVTSVEVV